MFVRRRFYLASSVIFSALGDCVWLSKYARVVGKSECDENHPMNVGAQEAQNWGGVGEGEGCFSDLGGHGSTWTQTELQLKGSHITARVVTLKKCLLLAAQKVGLLWAAPGGILWHHHSEKF